MNALITGAAGFIGSNFVGLYLQKYPDSKVVVLDKMTYAANLENLSYVMDQIVFIKGCIGDKALVSKILIEHEIDFVFNFAAESHVDNSIANPSLFIETNVVATFNLLQSCLNYYKNLKDKSKFRFLHISTDEVYGNLELNDGKIFTEKTPYAPNSPYSASKAASDHIVRSFVHTYSLPCITTNCSNNYGIKQHIEKLIPKTIMSCINQEKITIYGNGNAVRDWIWVDDHCNGILIAMEKGNIGETYCFGGDCEKDVRTVVSQICKTMNEIRPLSNNAKYENLIINIQDRLGHDLRYAVSSEKSKRELGFKHSISFEDGILKLIKSTLKIN